VYANRRRIRGARGKFLLRQRGEKLERWNQHLYDRGGMRRLHLRGRGNILKRLVVHSGAANLGLLMRTLLGAGTPRRLRAALSAFSRRMNAFRRILDDLDSLANEFHRYEHPQPTTQPISIAA
jgi:transposase